MSKQKDSVENGVLNECVSRLKELDSKNVELNKKMHSDGEGFIHKNDRESLEKNNKEMYDLRVKMRDMRSKSIKIQAVARGFLARKSFSEEEDEKNKNILHKSIK